MRGKRILHRARYRSERGLVQHEVRAFRGPAADDGVAHVAFVELEARKSSSSHPVRYVGEILAAAGRKVVDPDDVLALAEQRLDQMRTDETGGARDEPATGLAAQELSHL